MKDDRSVDSSILADGSGANLQIQKDRTAIDQGAAFEK